MGPDNGIFRLKRIIGFKNGALCSHGFGNKNGSLLVSRKTADSFYMCR
jgi:hypothetical protein